MFNGLANGFGNWVRVHARELAYGFWFIPGLVAAGHALLAVVMLAIDYGAGPSGAEVAPFDGGATAARTILAAVAGSLMTVAALTFTITIVSLQLMSSQFTPRALRGFLADRTNQVTAGVFVGTFLYCILVLRTVRTEEEEAAGFVPSLSVSVAILLSVTALAFLLVFIHHTTQTIQVSNAARDIAYATLGSVDSIYPEHYGEPVASRREEFLRRWRADGEPATLYAPKAGYIRTIGVADMMKRLPAGARVHLPYCPGDFVTARDVLAEIWPREAGEARAQTVDAAVAIAGERDLADDAEYGIRQLADIAIKALSPSVNDPTTAVTTVGYLRAILEHVAGRAIPADVRELDGDRVVAARGRTWEEYLQSMSEIARYGADAPRVVLALLHALAKVADAAKEAGAAERLESLRSVIDHVAHHAFEQLRVDADREQVERALERARAAV